MNIPSALVDTGSEVRLTEHATHIPGVAEQLERGGVEYPIDESRIVPFYSR